MKKILFLTLLGLSIPTFAEEIHEIKVRVHYVVHLMDIPINEGYNHPKYLGMGYPNPDTGVCDIFVLKPSGETDTHKLEILGHELLHCTDGPYHPVR